MMEKIQRFGGAMYAPAMLFAITGVLIGFGTLFTTEVVMGQIAAEGTVWYQFWNVVMQGAWTIFNQLPILFAVSLPITLAKKQPARACMEALVLYLVFNNYVSAMLSNWGASFGVDFSQEVGGSSGLALIANIKTLDMGMMGAILVSGIAIFLHNKYFEKRLPEWLGVFKGSALVVGIGFLVMLPVALLSCLIWPHVQNLISMLQTFMLNSGKLGIWVFIFLERFLIPTGLHHLILTPVFFDSALVPGGISAAWAQMLPDIARSAEPILSQAPWAAFLATGWAKMFGSVGAALAIYYTAKPENKKKVAGLLIPVTLTALVTGITEPLEFTFLFVAPALFFVHSLLAATFAVIANIFGVAGDIAGGLIGFLTLNILPLSANHWREYLPILFIAPAAVAAWYFAFRLLIKKFDFKTPGREMDEESVKLYSKNDYKNKNNTSKVGENQSVASDKFEIMAEEILAGLGGSENINDFTNCVTRLRVKVNNPDKVTDDNYFKEIGTYGTARNGKSVHVIVGMDIQYVADAFGKILDK